MKETISITSARANLLKLAKQARRRMDRFVLTNKGREEAVLLGIGDYRALVAAVRLAARPDVLAQTQKGFEELQRGRGVTLDEAFPDLAPRSKPSSR